MAARAGWYRIVQLSDIHIGPLLDRRFARALVEMANGAAPDAVVITGDAVDGTVARIGAEVEPFADLKARDGVYYVTGNHEHYYHPGEWCAAFERLGLTVLRNSGRRIGSGEASFYLAGVYDHRGDMGGGYREDLPAALAGRDPRWPVVLLAHDPATFAQAARLGVGLQLAGHTHGGQIWPFNYLVRLTTRYLHGLHRLDRSWLYVSRGSGFWGPPMRLFAPHEVTVLTLRPE